MTIFLYHHRSQIHTTFDMRKLIGSCRVEPVEIGYVRLHALEAIQSIGEKRRYNLTFVLT